MWRAKAKIAGEKPQGLSALLQQRPKPRPPSGRFVPTRLQGALAGLGTLVPIGEIVAKVKAKEEKGENLPGDPWHLDYQRWKDKVAAGELKADSLPPGALSEDDKKLFDEQYVKVLLPDLKTYVVFIYDKVFVKSQKPPTAAEATDLLFLYGCKQISRLMPGFAKVVLKRVPTQVDLIGDWTEEIPADLLAKEPKKDKPTKGKPPYKPPKRIEVVEVCTVTHRQLEETLRKDLGIVVAAVQPGKSATSDDDLVRPLSAALLRSSARARTSTVPGPGRPRLAPAAPATRTAAPATPRRGRRGRRRGRKARRAQKQLAAKQRVSADQQFFAAQRQSEAAQSRVSSQAKALRWAAAQSKLWHKLEKYDPRMKDTSFHDIAKRLLNFYRQSGSVRSFTRVLRENDKVVSTGTKPKFVPPDAQEEINHQASAKTVSTRNHREILRRKVGQWNYGYEYEQLGTFVEGKAGALLTDYRSAEAAVLDQFWDDCEEIRAICEGPVTKRERDSCMRCAIDAVKNTCLEGEETKGETKTCKGAYIAKFFDPRLPRVRKKDEPAPKLGAGGGDSSSSSDSKKKGKRKKKGRKKKKKKAKYEKWNATLSSADLPGKNTFLNWLALQVVEEGYDFKFHRGNAVRDLDFYQASVVQNLVDRRFLPNEGASNKEGVSNEGSRNFDMLPLTSWQRCVLWNPYHGTGPGQDPQLCDWNKGDMSALKKHLKGQIPWQQSRLFQMAITQPVVQRYLNSAKQFWDKECTSKKRILGVIKVRKWDCTKQAKKGLKRANKFLARKDPSKAGMGGKKNAQKAGGIIQGALGPIIGKLLGMLLKAAGLYEFMKTLAKAAGLTPEQSIDCEDPEYRAEVMKLSKGKSNKWNCLLRVFAKNFATMLERIIVMLGNKLVNWALKLLRTALEGVKEATANAIGAVPFVGKLFEIIFRVAWYVVFEVGIPMLLKGFVVAKLPVWLQVRKLAKQPAEKLFRHPIVRVIMGIIISLLDAAMRHGDKGWMAVGVDTALNAIQMALEGKKNWFWARALTFAKKEMLKNPPPAESSITDQLLHVAKGMIGGFGAAISRKIDDADVRQTFLTAVDDMKQMATPSGFSKLQSEFMKNPVTALANLVGKRIGPVVIPIVTTFVKMPTWAKKMVNRIGSYLGQIVDDITKRKFDWKNLIKWIVTVFEPVGEHFLGKLPIRDEALKEMVLKGYKGIVFGLQNIAKLKSDYLEKPWNIVKALVGLTGDYIKKKVTDLIKGSKLEPERELVRSLIDTILQVLADEKLRNKLFPDGRPDGRAILAQVGKLLGNYVKGRLQGLVRGTGLEGLVGAGVDAFFGPKGPFGLGAKFFTNLGTILKEAAPSIVAKVLESIAGIIKKQLKGSHSLGLLIDGLVLALSRAVKTPGGIGALFKGGTEAVVKFIKDAMEPLMKEVAPQNGDPSKAPISTLLHKGVGGILKLLSKAKALSTLSAGDLALVARSVKEIEPTMIDLLKQVMGNGEVGQVFGRALKGLYDILSTPAKLKSFLTRPGPKLFALIIQEAKEPLGKVVFSAVRDETLKPLARDALKAALDFVSQALSKGTSGLGQAARNIIGDLIPTIVTLAKKKIGDLFPERLKAFKEVVSKGFDTFGPFLAELIKSGKAAWDKLLQGGGKVLGKLIKAFLPMLKGPMTRAISYKPLRGLLTRLLDSVGNLIQDPAALVRAFKSKKLAMQKLLPELAKVIGPFAHDVLVKPVPRGIPRDIVEVIVKAGISFMEKPDTFDDFLEKAKSDPKGLVKKIVAGLMPALLGKAPKGLRKFFEIGLKTMTTGALK